MVLPISPPLEPMLAKLSKQIPAGEGWVYEPKWDGFRALVWRDAGSMETISRDGRQLDRYLPELAEKLAPALPETCVVDGEIVIGSADGLAFDALLQRIHPAESRIRMLAEATPASFVAFDLLALGSDDLTGRPLVERQRALVGALGPGESMPSDIEGVLEALVERRPRILLTPQTSDPSEAKTWLTRFEDRGLDGVVAKQLGDPYSPGKRTMVKVKRERTVDCVVGGYRVHKSGEGVGSLLLGLYDPSGALHYVGHTSSFKAAERVEVLDLLRPHEGEGGFGLGRAPGGPSRWSGGRDTAWVALRPELVCEVAFDRLMGARFRHAARFLRWRPDKPPRDCTFAQV